MKIPRKQLLTILKHLKKPKVRKNISQQSNNRRLRIGESMTEKEIDEVGGMQDALLNNNYDRVADKDIAHVRYGVDKPKEAIEDFNSLVLPRLQLLGMPIYRSKYDKLINDPISITDLQRVREVVLDADTKAFFYPDEKFPVIVAAHDSPSFISDVGHEMRHYLDWILGKNKTYAPHKVDKNQRLEAAYRGMDPLEQAPTNFEIRRKLLLSKNASRASLEEQNRIIDEATPEDIVQAMRGINGYSDELLKSFNHAYLQEGNSLLKKLYNESSYKDEIPYPEYATSLFSGVLRNNNYTNWVNSHEFVGDLVIPTARIQHIKGALKYVPALLGFGGTGAAAYNYLNNDNTTTTY